MAAVRASETGEVAEVVAQPTPPGSGRFGTRRFAVGLVAVALLALAIRWTNVLVWQPTITPEAAAAGEPGYSLRGDSQIYHYQALALAEGHGYVDPARWIFLDRVEKSAVSPPVYSSYLGLWSFVGLRTVTQHRLVSGLLGAGTVVLLGLAGRELVLAASAASARGVRISPTAVGLTAATLAAVYPGLWINDGVLLSECAAIFGVALFLWALYRVVNRRSSTASVVAAGLAAGFVGLTRTELLLLFPLALVPALLLPWSGGPDWRRRFAAVLIAGAAAGVIVMPWLVRNLVSFSEPTLLGGQTGTVLAAGSCDDVYYGDRIGLYAECFQDFPTAAEERGMDESERDLAPRAYALDYIGDHLDRLPVVAAARLGRVWMVYRPLHTTRTVDIALERRGHTASFMALGMYYAMVPLAAAGLVAMRRRRIPTFPLVAPILTVSIASVITFANTRYRAPFEVALVLGAAVGLVALFASIQARTVRADGSAS